MRCNSFSVLPRHGIHNGPKRKRRWHGAYVPLCHRLITIIQIIIIFVLWTLIVCIYPCRYRSTANRKMDLLRRCRHAVSGFLRLRSEVRRREDYAVIHQPAPKVQTVRCPIHEELTRHCRTCREDSVADCKRYS